MNIEILEIAQKELDDAVLYYELEQPGLGSRFKYLRCQARIVAKIKKTRRLKF